MRSYDFGYGKPFSCAWWAIDYDGVIYRILELYGCTGTPNEGVRWTPDQQFAEIARIEREHPWLRGKKIEGVADPAIWDASRGESIADTAARYGLYFTKGDNERIPGWMQCHYRLQFDEEGYSRMYVFSNCAAFIRTVPGMMFSRTAPEDLDTEMTLMGVLISNSRSQAVTETKLEELTREVREHNNFARRVPVVEEQIRVMDRRMTALEKYKE